MTLFEGEVIEGSKVVCNGPERYWVGASMLADRERERSTRGDRVLFSSVGLWEGFLGVRITRIPYRFVGCDPVVGGLPPTYLC